jgi:hypothetical protein
MAEKARQCQRARDHLAILEAEVDAVRRRLFLRLEEVYPGVEGLRDGGTGIRRFQGGLYYVGWDEG